MDNHKGYAYGSTLVAFKSGLVKQALHLSIVDQGLSIVAHLDARSHSFCKNIGPVSDLTGPLAIKHL